MLNEYIMLVFAFLNSKNICKERQDVSWSGRSFHLIFYINVWRGAHFFNGDINYETSLSFCLVFATVPGFL